MPLYESETIDRDQLEKIRKQSTCAVCGEWLNTFLDPTTGRAFVACNQWLRTHHDGVAKEHEQRELNIESRREQVEQNVGVDKAHELAKYQSVTTLNRAQAMEVLQIIWPDAPAVDRTAAAILCADYGLNPLAGHVFLIKFGDKWARVWGIKAKRLIASRKGGYSYLDMTPRLMTNEEQIKVNGSVDQNNICFLTHLKDMKTGAEAYGFGKWPKALKVYGTDKGNSAENMAGIRSESQALDRLRPAEMPSGWVAADEQYIEGEYKAVVAVEASPVNAGSENKGTEAQGQSDSQAGKDTAVTTVEGLLKMTFKNAGEMKTACLNVLHMSAADIEKETSIYDLSNPGQRKKAWEQVVGVYGEKPAE